MIKLSEIIEAKKKTEFGSHQGESSLRRIALTKKTTTKLLSGPFSNATNRFTIDKTDNGLYRLAEPMVSKEPGDLIRRQSKNDLVIPTKAERSSKDSSNIYTVFMSRLPSWKGWPRRSFSVIFFIGKPTSSEYEYGSNLFKLLPKNESKIVVTTTSDLLNVHSMPHMESILSGPHKRIIDVSSFGEMMGSIVYYSKLSNEDYKKNPSMVEMGKSAQAKYWVKDIRYNDYDKVIKLLNLSLSKKTYPKIKEVLEFGYNSGAVHQWRKDTFIQLSDTFEYYVSLLDKYGDWEKILSEAFDPEKNGLKLMTVENVNNPYDKEVVEAWTESPCVMLNMGDYSPDV